MKIGIIGSWDFAISILFGITGFYHMIKTDNIYMLLLSICAMLFGLWRLTKVRLEIK